jgi:hemolysin III
LRGRLHQIAFVASVVALVWLVRSATTARAEAAAWIYGLSAVLAYLASAAYHRLGGSPRVKQLLRKGDHSAIFVLIAGTFTPICLLVMTGPWRWVLLSIAWVGAAAGVVFKLLAIDRFPKLGGALYLTLGWVGLFALPALAHQPGRLALIAAGGLLYTVGAVLFFLQRPRLRPRWFGYHEVWHAFGITAWMLIFAAIAGLVRAG